MVAPVKLSIIMAWACRRDLCVRLKSTITPGLLLMEQPNKRCQGCTYSTDDLEKAVSLIPQGAADPMSIPFSVPKPAELDSMIGIRLRVVHKIPVPSCPKAVGIDVATTGPRATSSTIMFSSPVTLRVRSG